MEEQTQEGGESESEPRPAPSSLCGFFPDAPCKGLWETAAVPWWSQNQASPGEGVMWKQVLRPPDGVRGLAHVLLGAGVHLGQPRGVPSLEDQGAGGGRKTRALESAWL